MKNKNGVRNITKLKRKTRAIEPVIASLLLIAIAVAAAVVTYSWVMGMISNQQSQAGTSLGIDLVQFTKTGTTKDKILITVRNKGTVATTLSTVYLTYPNATIATFDGAEASAVLVLLL